MWGHKKADECPCVFYYSSATTRRDDRSTGQEGQEKQEVLHPVNGPHRPPLALRRFPLPYTRPTPPIPIPHLPHTLFRPTLVCGVRPSSRPLDFRHTILLPFPPHLLSSSLSSPRLCFGCAFHLCKTGSAAYLCERFARIPRAQRTSTASAAASVSRDEHIRIQTLSNETKRKHVPARYAPGGLTGGTASLRFEMRACFLVTGAGVATPELSVVLVELLHLETRPSPGALTARPPPFPNVLALRSMSETEVSAELRLLSLRDEALLDRFSSEGSAVGESSTAMATRFAGLRMTICAGAPFLVEPFRERRDACLDIESGGGESGLGGRVPLAAKRVAFAAAFASRDEKAPSSPGVYDRA